jgi:L-iditol 2-dehydrogenase
MKNNVFMWAKGRASSKVIFKESMIMKALVYHGPFDMRLEEIERPEPGPLDVLIKVKAVGICGSDIHGYSGKTGRRSPGMVMGHEFCGAVEALGSSVKRFKIGQKVVVQPIIFCGKCEMCLSGNTSICPSKKFIGVDMGKVGGLSEYIAVPQNNVFCVPESLPYSLACLVEPFAVGVSAGRKADIQKGQSVAIVGAGVIGLIIVLMVRQKSPSKIFIIDKNVRKLELAQRLGGIAINFTKENAIERILHDTNQKGADISIEAVGTSESVKTAMYAIKNGGRVIWVGNSQKNIDLNMQDVVVKGKSIQGIYCYSNDDFKKAIEFIDQNREIASEFVEEQVVPEYAPDLFGKLAKEELEVLRGIVLFEK